MYQDNFKRNKRKRINVVLFCVFIFALIMTCVISMMAYEENEVYRNESEFRKYADHQLEENQMFEMANAEVTDYEYGEKISYAVDYTVYDNELIEAFRDSEIATLKKEFENEIKAAAATEGSDEEEAISALILSSSVYESDNGIINLAIYERGSAENGREMKTIHTDVHTYQFSRKTGDVLVPPQIFEEDYRVQCSEYFTDYFLSYYTDEELADGWEDHLSASEENFNEYIVSSTGVTFFFDEGTVLDKSEGEVYAGLAALQADDILRDKIIERYIDPSKPMVALTYDDGPGVEAEDRILSCLEKNNAVATFFYQGMFISGREDKIKRAKEIGCEIGHHTWNHPVLTSLTDAEVKAQITNTNNAIYEACGSYPTVFRPSYGITSDKINSMSGMPVIMWSVDTLDWDSRDGQKVFDHVKSRGNLDGHIVLMHSIHDSTADATEMIVPWLKSQGYQLVTVTELIKYKTGAAPIPGKSYRTYK